MCVLNTAERADRLYALWIAERRGIVGAHAATLHGVNPVVNGKYAMIGGQTVELPGPTTEEWAATVRAARVRCGLEQSSTRKDSIQVGGITVTRRWEWSKQREAEERDNVRRLSRGADKLSRYMTRFADEVSAPRVSMWRYGRLINIGFLTP